MVTQEQCDKIKFGSWWHNALVRTDVHWLPITLKSKWLEFLITDLIVWKHPHWELTAKGKEVLNRLRMAKLTPGQELTLTRVLLDIISDRDNIPFALGNYNGRIDYLLHNGYIAKVPLYSLVEYKLTNKGRHLLEKHCIKLLHKQLQEGELKRLVDFLPLEVLPAYLSNVDELIREAAKRRMSELQKAVKRANLKGDMTGKLQRKFGADPDEILAAMDEQRGGAGSEMVKVALSHGFSKEEINFNHLKGYEDLL